MEADSLSLSNHLAPVVPSRRPFRLHESFAMTSFDQFPPSAEVVKRRWAEDRTGGLKRLRNAFAPLPSRAGAPGELRVDDVPAKLEEAAITLLTAEAEVLFIARRDQALRAEARATTL